MKIGIIGGSGLYDLEGVKIIKSRRLDTPFGEPSDEYVLADLNGIEIYFLPRHGRGHRLLPCEINNRANILGFKMLGVDRILSVSAVGSLQEKLRPRDIVLPDQYFDRTKSGREHTFFGDGVVAHVSFAEPACSELRGIIAAAAEKVIHGKGGGLDVRVNRGGTYVNMEGPAFSTKAESGVYRMMGFDVIGMTSLAEAKLCREAEICYQAMAMVTDYDCWRDSEESVTAEMVIENLSANIVLAKEVLREVVSSIPNERCCRCGTALKAALFSRPDTIPADTRKKLQPILQRYL